MGPPGVDETEKTIRTKLQESIRCNLNCIFDLKNLWDLKKHFVLVRIFLDPPPPLLALKDRRLDAIGDNDQFLGLRETWRVYLGRNSKKTECVKSVWDRKCW